MGMLDRYKKKGGFLQLLILIETSSKQKQEQFLTLISQENQSWEKFLRDKLLSIDRILNWPGEQLAEIFSRVQPLTLSTVMSGFESQQRDNYLSCLSQSEKKKILQMMSEASPSAAEISSCKQKLIGETRGLVTSGIIKLEKFDPALAIEENIEELIAQAAVQSNINEMVQTLQSSQQEAPTSSSGLRFELPSAEGKNELKGDVDFLKKKINTLTTEITNLKHENSILRGKLDQIKKIA